MRSRMNGNASRRANRRGVLRRLLAVILTVAAASSASSMGLRDTVPTGDSTPGDDDRRIESERPVDVVSLAQGTYSGVTEERFEVVEGRTTFVRLWREAHSVMVPAPEPPDIDFSSELVVAVFMGKRTSGGYAIEVTGAYETTDAVRVAVARRAPGPDDLVTMAITSPYHIVALPRRDKPVVVDPF